MGYFYRYLDISSYQLWYELTNIENNRLILYVLVPVGRQ